MKIIKFILLFLLTFTIANGKDSTKVLQFPYSFQTGSVMQDTDAKFIAYGDEFKNAVSLAEGIEKIFSVANNDSLLSKLISKEEEDVDKAKSVLNSLGDFASLKFSYVIFDKDNMIALLESDKACCDKAVNFILINGDGKWEVSKCSPLYSYLSKNAKKAEFAKENKKVRNEIEMLTADSEIVDVSTNEQLLETNEIFFYYMDLYNAFFAKNFDKFRTFLDADSGYAFDAKTGGATSAEDIAKALGNELKEDRGYRNMANLGDIYFIFFDSHTEGEKETSLKYGIVRDISCGVEIMNYGLELDPVMCDFISR